MSIYIEEAEIVSVGTKWDKGKSKKKQVKSHFYTDDGIQFKDFANLIESYDDTIHKHRGAKIKCTVEFIEYEWSTYNIYFRPR